MKRPCTHLNHRIHFEATNQNPKTSTVDISILNNAAKKKNKVNFRLHLVHSLIFDVNQQAFGTLEFHNIFFQHMYFITGWILLLLAYICSSIGRIYMVAYFSNRFHELIVNLDSNLTSNEADVRKKTSRLSLGEHDPINGS